MAVLTVALGVVLLLRGTGADQHTTPAPTPATEQSALDALHPACVEDSNQLDAQAKKALILLQGSGVRDETVTTVLVHLRDALPADATGLDCATALSAYVTQRGTGG